jgi:hypothetical protein
LNLTIDTKHLFPQASPRVQLFAAAVLWLIGAGMLLRNAMIFLAAIDSSLWWIPPIGLLLGLLKAYFLMIPSAEFTATRIKKQGRSWLFNCYTPKVYLMVGSMITLGALLRTLGPVDNVLYQQILAVLYLTVGVGLFLSDGVYWSAVRQEGAHSNR